MEHLRILVESFYNTRRYMQKSYGNLDLLGYIKLFSTLISIIQARMRNHSWICSTFPDSCSIYRQTISNKGECVTRHKDRVVVRRCPFSKSPPSYIWVKPFCNWYFLRGECYKCIVFHKRHVNVLQYKESKRQPFQ